MKPSESMQREGRIAENVAMLLEGATEQSERAPWQINCG